jgi:hypothetical protein
MLDLNELQLQIIPEPPIIICSRCCQAFTGNAIYSHMLDNHGYKASRDVFQGALLKSNINISGLFKMPVQPIRQISGIPLIQGELCGFPSCSEFFVNPDALVSHMAINHPGASPRDSISCDLQEVEDSDDRTLRFRVISESQGIIGKRDLTFGMLSVDLYFVQKASRLMKWP